MAKVQFFLHIIKNYTVKLTFCSVRVDKKSFVPPVYPVPIGGSTH